MNVGQEAHLSRQMSGQPVQMNSRGGSGQRLQVASGHHGMDAKFVQMRRTLYERIVERLREKKKNAARRSLEQLASRLEGTLYMLHSTKADYYVMLNEPMDQLLQVAIKVLSTQGHQRQQMSQQTPTSSTYATMVPPPGSMSNGYQDPSTNLPQNCTTISISSAMCPVSMPQQVTHMIPTPGFSNQKTLPVNFEYSNEAGYLNGESNVMPQVQQQQQKPFSIDQSSYPMQHVGTHVGSGVHSRMLENSSAYGLSDKQINGGMGLHGSSMQLTNRAAPPEGFMNLPPYSSSPDKLLQQELNSPPPQRTARSAGMSVYGTFYGTVSSVLTPTSHTTKKPFQPKPLIKAEVLDQKEKVNIRKSHLSYEQLQQQRQFKPNRPCSQFVQNQGILSRINSLKQCQLGSGRDERLSDERVLPYNEPMYSKATEDSDKRDQTSQQFVSKNSQQLLSPHVANTILTNKQFRDDFCQRTMSQDAAQQPISSDGLIAGRAMTSIDPKLSKLPTRGSEQATRNIKHYLQPRWLLLLTHAKSCQGPLDSCKSQDCVRAQELLKHVKNCQRKDCSYRYCSQSKKVICHCSNYVNKQCPVCSKAKESLCRYSEQTNKLSDAKPISITKSNGDRMDIDLVAVETFDDQPSVSKRSRFPNVSDSAHDPVPQACPGFVLQKAHPKYLGQDKRIFPKQELNMKCDIRSPQKPTIISSCTTGKIGAAQSYMIPDVPNELDSHVEQENWLSNKDTNDNVPDIEKNVNGSTHAMLSKRGKTKRKGISLMELFTPEEIYEHILSLSKWVGQSKAKAEKKQAIGHSESENLCQLCKVERLTFEPPPIYCSPCGARIKLNAPYYIGTINYRHYYFCVPCYNESRSDSILVDSIQLLKSKLEKRRNDDELEEAWVACDKCKRWQHQICALFNAKRNEEEEEAEYTCHNCYIQEIKHGFRMPLPKSTVLGAEDLPRTVLSDHIEERLFQRLKEERQNRANKNGKSFNEVPGAEGLVVRVVSSVDKKLEVKQHFLEIFQEENYPTEFPYKSKTILLFQRIEGVEVCLFGMYVQEFGAECAFPNQRRVYLSYLDSVKYFRPEIETVSGEALRTFVYHEILIGYLQYCKQRGFTSCYIWACPPLKGEDYIMYCHPEIQKTPKSDKLREWYLSMLRKATKEDIVVELTNLYEHFFTPKRECKAKVTAVRLPYFDGDYWPGAAEDIINQIFLPEDNRILQKKGKIKNSIKKRTLKAAGLTDLCGNASKDAMLMQKLGEIICPMKEDFIMVHLQYSCSHCCIFMVSGRRWICNQCKSFYICDKCYNVEQQREEMEKHPSNSTDSHTLHPVEIVGVPKDTKDRDDTLESESFDTRQAFLSLCQGNHYQYDTLRRAKHSSMMVLYHLHNPTQPAFVTTCNVCENDIETGQGWRCKECDYDECASCYKNNGGVNHVHKLTKHPAGAYRDAQNTRQKRVQKARKMLESLAHAVACRAPGCQYPNCRKLKALFHHGKKCQKRASGGCPLCKKMWGIIQFHARACKESQCNVPRCSDLKEHMRRLQSQSESRRRSAVNEMMRQRAAEVGVSK
ncbi:probable histone acetyltransferase HAC-like 1 [Phragmites australis]|uniref:probable histone acetyltransferase HAC-like 1 n=1 Tax=Phragmites australis TaxID=29695 RepID=UPI002D76E73D|nr:probable histone acetyltransferase HAC-like 1 [Phragmites australis]